MKLSGIERLPDGSPFAPDLNDFVKSVRASLTESDKQGIAQAFTEHADEMMKQIRERKGDT